MTEQQNAGNTEIMDMIVAGDIFPDNVALNRQSPQGVMQVGLKKR